MTSRLERLLEIEETIRTGCYPSLESLCQQFSVKPSTIYDDIRILRERLGLKIQFDRNRNGYFNADPSKRLPEFELTKSDMVLIVAALNLLSNWFGGEGTRAKIKNLINKIADRTNNNFRNEITLLESVFKKRKIRISKDTSLPLNSFLKLVQLYLENKPFEIQYTSKNEIKTSHVLSSKQINIIQCRCR